MMRAYQPSDLAKIMEIGNRAWKPIYEMYRTLYGEELFQILAPNVSTAKGEQIKHHCEQYPDEVMICEENGRVVGFITFSVNAQTRIGIVGNNATDPECGLKGIGQQMYKAALDYFRARGMRYAQVTTGMDSAHAPARRAYERSGFAIRREDATYFMKLS